MARLTKCVFGLVCILDKEDVAEKPTPHVKDNKVRMRGRKKHSDELFHNYSKFKCKALKLHKIIAK